MTERELSTVVDDADAGERADVVAGRRLAGVSRRSARTLGLQGRLFLDDRACPPSTRVQPGQHLALRWSEAHDPAPPPLRLLRLTPRVVYVAKPVGLHTHRVRPDDPPSLADAVLARFPECGAASLDVREAGALHRLDRETSGVVAFARDRASWSAGREAFSAMRVDKIYVAVCRTSSRAPWPPADLPRITTVPPVAGVLGPGVRIDRRLGEGSGGRVIPRPDGRPARTDAWCLALHRGARQTRAVVSLRLHTGRRHQARAHLASIGWPIEGDPLHPPAPGLPPSAATRMMLHALSIDLSRALPFEQPVGAPWPVPMFVTRANLRLGRPRVDRPAGG